MRLRIPFSFVLASYFVLSLNSITVQAQSPVSQYHNGWPSRTGEIDIRKGFVNPPSGYGNVPFYWWSGDSLKLERLTEQLDILADASTSGLNISYNHTHSQIDTVYNANGHGYCGRVQGGAPRVMSDEWWKIWNQFSGKCAEKGVGLGMDDYVLAWHQNGEFIDTVLGLPGIKDYQGRLKMAELGPTDPLPDHVITKMKKPQSDTLWVIYSVPSPELSPLFGQKIVEYYFQPFYDHMDEKGRQGMNYFFQDELQYDLAMDAWCEDMQSQFRSRKGYDITPYLFALFENIGPDTEKYRLDYAQVVTELSHERYFKPIYDWCASRGLIYGSDNQGRGLDPMMYLDYFQAEQWFTAPGNDAPARGSSFNQTKVSSSIAHLYQRPRTWLEAFHSMGWDANGALLTHQLDHHIIAGGNLLCMHGLYYGTHGGWWEWAPPSFHFRMPYWPHMKVWLKYAERLCFLMSQGVHVADVAILYPTETMQAVPGTQAGSTIAVGEYLSQHGLDYDYLNYSNLQLAKVEDGRLRISDENYKVLVCVDTKAMHEETLQKIQEFQQNGGLVITVGDVMDQLQQLNGHVAAQDAAQVLKTIRDQRDADFVAKSGGGRVLHRHVGDDDVYMVMDVKPGDQLFFRAHGKLEQWDAQHGTMKEVPALRVTEQGTWITNQAEEELSRLYVFSPSDQKPLMESDVKQEVVHYTSSPIDGEWKMEILPTMNNKWGDFRLPATNEIIGIEARDMESKLVVGGVSRNITWDELKQYQLDTLRVFGFAPYMQVSINGGAWQDYNFSWQYGVYDNPGGQGYHGLKAKIDPRFLILDHEGRMDFRTGMYVPSDGIYRMEIMGVRPSSLYLDGIEVGLYNQNLTAGWHDLRLTYLNTKAGSFSLENLRYSTDDRARSMVVFYPKDAPAPQAHGPYDTIVASPWYNTDHLAYDPYMGLAKHGEMLYHFQTAPGTQTLKLAVNGTIHQMWVDGQRVKVGKNGIVKVKKHNPHVGEAFIVATPDTGCVGTAFFRDPVKITCKGGLCEAGDWSTLGAMKFYSGGVRYSKDVTVNTRENKQVLIDLGEVDATCEVAVNGKKVDVLINKPYQLDITSFLKNGKNRLDVLVYSSLSAHYQTRPTPYRGTPHAGLIGPVKLLLAPADI